MMIENEIKTKRCTKCGIDKSLDDYYYHTLRGKVVPHSECKICTCKMVKEYKNSHLLEYKAYAKKNHHDYYVKNKDKILEKCKLNYPKKKQQSDIHNKEYYQAHREELLIKRKKYRENNKDAINARTRKYSHDHPDKIKLRYYKKKDKIIKNTRERSLRIKTEVLTHYGFGKCICVRCGFNDMRALTIDHINGNGSEHRKNNKEIKGQRIYWWLIKNGFPDGYQTLCMNCQFIKRYQNKEFYGGV